MLRMTAVTQNPTQNNSNGHKCASCGSTTTAKRMSGKERWHDIGRGRFLCETCYRKKRKAGEIPAGKRGRRTGTDNGATPKRTKRTNAQETQQEPSEEVLQTILARVESRINEILQERGLLPLNTKQGRPDKETLERARVIRQKVAEILKKKHGSEVAQVNEILQALSGASP